MAVPEIAGAVDATGALIVGGGGGGGGGGAGAAGGATGPTDADTGLASPRLFVAVTITRIVEPTSAATSRSDAAFTPAIFVQVPEAHLCHAKAYEVTPPDQD